MGMRVVAWIEGILGVFGLPAVMTLLAFLSQGAHQAAITGMFAGLLWARAANEMRDIGAFVEILSSRPTA